MSAPQVQGLFLSGGHSQRMGTDKGLLCYGGQQTEIERWKAVFDQLHVPFFWSQRPAQYPADLFPHIPRVIDRHPGSGPLAALLSAHRWAPTSAWLVLACDWPLLGFEDMQHLLQNRRSDLSATSYVHQGRREPLCSLYEPDFLRAAEASWQAGESSLNRLLQAATAWEIPALDAKRWMNANDEAARQHAEVTVRQATSQNLPHQNAR